MKHSGRKSERPVSVAFVALVALVALELFSRLALPASVLALAHGRASLAALGSVAAGAASVARSLVQARAIRDAVARTWRRLIDAAMRQPASTLRMRREDRDGILTLVDGARATATHEALVLPEIAALALAFAVVVIVVAVVLGPAWLALGGVVAAAVGALVLLGQRRVRRAADRSWARLGEVARDVRVLLEATTELRACDREESLCEEILRNVDAMALDERAAAAWNAGVGVVPAAVAVLAVAAPVRAGMHTMVSGMAPERVADVGVLGAAAMAIGVGLVRTVSSAVGSAPFRKTLSDFLARGSATPLPAGAGQTVPRSLALASFELRGVSCVHPGAAYASPEGVSFRWEAHRGLAVSGENGAGKSTLALALLGLLTPAEGSITVDGVPLAELDLRSYRRHAAYIPQGSFTAPGMSVKWHLTLIAGTEASDTRIDEALSRVGLYEVLAEHAAEAGGAPRDVLAGELSGGERQRMLLARALLQDAELVILDEPEAGLDTGGRALLRSLLEELSTSRKVMVIAHDESVVPASFARLVCRRGPLPTPSQKG